MRTRIPELNPLRIYSELEAERKGRSNFEASYLTSCTSAMVLALTRAVSSMNATKQKINIKKKNVKQVPTTGMGNKKKGAGTKKLFVFHKSACHFRLSFQQGAYIYKYDLPLPMPIGQRLDCHLTVLASIS